MDRLVCHKWGLCGITWVSANWKWSECQLVRDIITGIDATQALPQWLQEPYDPYNKTDQEKRKKFVKLLVKIKGENLKEIEQEKHENAKISIKDVQLVVKTMTGIEIEVIGE